VPESFAASDPSKIPSALLERFGELEFLGSGGMGTVYRARDRQLGRDVAIKFLHHADPETNRLLLREARAQARLTHENACRVYEAGIDGARPYIIMQYIAGEPLDLACKRMTLEEKVRAVEDIALALHEAHRLGIVHRDVKPSNIMIERGEDGTYKPYIMDFGIAREIGRSSQTTSSFAGTPSYMAPEQARGDVEALDRRTDVYSLGATLYDLLSGNPPFEGSNPLAVMRKLLMDDAPPLRKKRAEVPVDLEAIVMKCLEKDPIHRYESARAFGDDLRRFLDGAPVLARKASLGYVLSKAVRRYKKRLAVAAAMLAAASTFGSLWVAEQREKAEQADIARELGEDVKEMELFLSRAYSLPLHDIERERHIVREQLREIEVRMASLGRVGEGPGHYALGRGFLALQEHKKAYAQLSQAEAVGYAPPELRYAMGLALVELYRGALEETKRIQDEARRKERIAEIDAKYKEPALAHLRAALGARLSSPAYVEGLIALHEGRLDDALEKSREALLRAPWLHEAKKLEGDVFLARGKQFGRDATFDHDKMMASFEPAAAAYEEAADIARSDPAVHEAECELWTQVVLASDARPDLLRPSFEKATRACGNALAADPRRVSARLSLAFAQNVFTWQSMNKPETEDLDKLIRTGIERSEEAARLHGDNPMAHYLVGLAHRTAFVHHVVRGLDARGSLDKAIAAYEEAIRLDPAFLWPRNEACASYVERATSEIWRGLDPEASVKRAVAHCDEAIAMDPSFTLPATTKAYAHLRQAQYLVGRGHSPEAAVERAISAAAAVRERNKPNAAGMSAWALVFRAHYACDSGQDPHDTLAQAEAFVREREELAKSASDGELMGLISLTRGRYLLRQGKDPTPEIDAARAFFHEIVLEAPWDIDYRVDAARAEVLALRWALSRGDAGRALFERALASLSPVLDEERANPQVYEVLAEVHELWAGALLDKKKYAEKEIENGFVMANKALALDSGMAAALASKGGLKLLSARGSRDAEEREKLAGEAKELLEAAFVANPLLGKEREAELAEAKRLVSSKGLERTSP